MRGASRPTRPSPNNCAGPSQPWPSPARAPAPVQFRCTYSEPAWAGLRSPAALVSSGHTQKQPMETRLTEVRPDVCRPARKLSSTAPSRCCGSSALRPTPLHLRCCNAARRRTTFSLPTSARRFWPTANGRRPTVRSRRRYRASTSHEAFRTERRHLPQAAASSFHRGRGRARQGDGC